MNLSKSAIVAAEFAVGLSITTVSNAATNSGSKNSGNNYVCTSIPDQGLSVYAPALSQHGIHRSLSEHSGVDSRLGQALRKLAARPGR